jgi:hypothetical protein
MPILYLFIFLLFLELIVPGLGANFFVGGLAIINVIVTSKYVGLVIGLVFLIPAYLFGWNGAINLIYTQAKLKAQLDKEKNQRSIFG